MVREFSHGRLVSWRMARLSGLSWVPVPDTDHVYKTPVFRHEPGTRVQITRSPLLRDPYEMRHVYVASSGVAEAGEGLWAKTDLAQAQLVALFNGVRQRHLCHVTARPGWSDYRICCDHEVDLDILSSQVDLANYAATLAHKTCHSFTPNASFQQMQHPRFGLIMSVVADREIRRGEEVLVSYNYNVAESPAWYRAAWFSHLREGLEWSEERIQAWCDKLYRQTGQVRRM